MVVFAETLILIDVSRTTAAVEVDARQGFPIIGLDSSTEVIQHLVGSVNMQSLYQRFKFIGGIADDSGCFLSQTL